ncbi:MAG: hypothetical protein HRT68_12015 [Flavobacteriaceae bacterium]|nr:hypothetical protein [Flavobacteriaceae bacterium]
MISLIKICYALIVVLALTTQVIAQKKQEIRPKKFVSIVYIKGPSDFLYYALSEKSKTTIEVEGPGKLTVYNRVRLEKNQPTSTPYYLKYVLDDRLITSRKVGPQKKSEKIKYKKNLPGTPSKADKEVIKIPPGKHKLTFFKHKTMQKAHVRFVYQKSDKISWRELKNNKDSKGIKIQYTKSKKEQTYFRVTNKNSFSFSAENNSKLRVFLRADFDYKIHNQNIIRLIVKKDGKQIGTYKVTCKKSIAVDNLTYKKLIPGSLEKIFIDLPKGQKGKYEILLKDPNKSAMIRVFVDDKKQAQNTSV